MAKTIYCAQAFWVRRGRLVGGQVHQFLNEERALEGGAILALSADGMAVFTLTGDPAADYWDDPVIIHQQGLAPALAA